ncbi:MAG: nucleoside phosphorylase [Saprospiraceae bacterium]
MSTRIPESELIINPNGSIYHLNLKPNQIADDIIFVGDPDRVSKIAKHFDNIEFEISKREFKTITGTKNNVRLTVISTGIGTDNIDIVLSELDALANIDFENRTINKLHKSLNIYRVGTSGGLIPEIKIGSIVISHKAIGLDGLMHYYNVDVDKNDQNLIKKACVALKNIPNITPYVSNGSAILLEQFKSLGRPGITTTATGFYGPQGRKIIGQPKSLNFLDDLASIVHQDLKVTNLEMETAGIYGLATLLGHQAISLNAILANRADQTFSDNPHQIVEKLIVDVLNIICNK